MSYCPNCGANNPDSSSFCSSCGTALTGNVSQQVYTPVQTQPSYVTPISTGGMMAWAIVTLLLCTIPGIVAIAKTANVNKSFTYEEQMQKLSSARTWCIVGTVLGILAIIGMLAQS